MDVAPIDIYRTQFGKEGYNNDQNAFWHTYAIDHLPSAGELIDVGTGRGIFLMRLLTTKPRWSIKATCDLDKFHDLPIPSVQIDLTTAAGLHLLRDLRAPYMTCLGVLEHLPKEQVPSAIAALAPVAVERAIITTANHRDRGVTGAELHLTREPIEWWREQLAERYEIEDSCSYAKDRGFCFTLKPKRR